MTKSDLTAATEHNSSIKCPDETKYDYFNGRCVHVGSKERNLPEEIQILNDKFSRIFLTMNQSILSEDMTVLIKKTFPDGSILQINNGSVKCGENETTQYKTCVSFFINQKQFPNIISIIKKVKFLKSTSLFNNIGISLIQSSGEGLLQGDECGDAKLVKRNAFLVWSQDVNPAESHETQKNDSNEDIVIYIPDTREYYDSAVVPWVLTSVESETEDGQENNTRFSSAFAYICEPNILSCETQILEPGMFKEDGSAILVLGQVRIEQSDYFAEKNSSVKVCSNALVKIKMDGSDMDMMMDESFASWVFIMADLGFALVFFFLLLTLLTYSLFPSMRTLPGKIVMNLSFTLIIGEMLLLGNRLFTDYEVLCKFLGFNMQYWWQTAFLWMNVLGYDLSRTFSNLSIKAHKSDEEGRYKMYTLFAYGVPALFILVCAAVDLGLDTSLHYGSADNADYKSCFVNDKMNKFYTFAIPLIMVISLNVVFFIRSVIGICSAMRIAKKAQTNSSKSDRLNIFLYLKISSVMGFNWIFILILEAYRTTWVLCCHVFCNGFQGVFIFTCFCANRRVWNMYKQRFCRVKNTDSNSSASSSATQVSSVSNGKTRV